MDLLIFFRNKNGEHSYQNHTLVVNALDLEVFGLVVFCLFFFSLIFSIISFLRSSIAHTLVMCSLYHITI